MAFAVGAGLHLIAPIPVFPPAVAKAAGLSVLALSVALMAWARLTLYRDGTGAMPGGQARALSLGGPYRLSRNPMCLAMGGVYLGFSILLNGLAPLLLFIPAFTLMDRYVIPWEERALEARFGAPYLAFKSRVRRWL
jgi:protein-S-isoprenylcysteine O-methyltransferase Ste14